MGRKSNKPPRKQCPYGFTCSQMTLQPDIIAENCWFLKDCREIKQDSNRNIDDKEKKIKQQILEVTKEIVQYIQLESNQRQKTKRSRLSQRHKFLLRVIPHEKAVFELKKFGNSQLADNFGIYEQTLQITEFVKRIRTQINNNNGLSNLKRGYIAPQGVEVHTYNTKHPPSGKFPPGTPVEEIRKQQTIYQYHKLLSTTAQFKSETTDSGKRKVIHLGKNDSEKNIQARLGIERRNRLAKISTLIDRAAEALQEAAELADEVLCFEDFRGSDNETLIDSE